MGMHDFSPSRYPSSRRARARSAAGLRRGRSVSLGARSLIVALTALLGFVCMLPSNVAAQKRPKPALREKDARRAIAGMPGFELKTGAVKVKEVSAAGASPVRVSADVTLAFRFAWAEDESATQNTGLFKTKRWRVVEFRAGDREWEDFDLVFAAVGDGKVEDARRALERLVEDYVARPETAGDENASQESSSKGEGAPFVSGPLSLKSFSTLGSSAVAEISVEASFTLARDARRKWRVVEFSLGDTSSGDAASLLRRLNARKSDAALRDLEDLRAALEAYRRELGFYVVAEDSTALVDHLSPRFIGRVIRIDPWHNPYRYAGTGDRFALSSDGADGLANTSDDVRLSGGR